MPIKGLTDRGMAFVEIGRIRKGEEKEDGARKPGADLKHFRVTFHRGEEAAAEKFRQVYGDAPDSINVWLPFRQLDDDVWYAYVEAFLAGGMIYKSDGERVIYWRDPDTGAALVKEGLLTEAGLAKGIEVAVDDAGTEYVPCVALGPDPKPVGYYVNQGGKRQPVFAKPRGLLKVIVRELERFSFLTFITHSQHDIANISSQLEGLRWVQEQAGLPGLSGIPLVLRRRPKLVSVPMEGRRVRMEKWLVHLEPNPDWVRVKQVAMLEASIPDAPELPATAGPSSDADAGQDDEVVEGEIVQPPRAPVEKDAAAPQPEPMKRPYPPAEVRRRVQALVARYASATPEDKRGEKMTLRQRVGWQLRECFPGDKTQDEKSHSVLAYLWGEGKASTKLLTGPQLAATERWLDSQLNQAGDLVPALMSRQEAQAIVVERMAELGQPELATDDEVPF